MKYSSKDLKAMARTQLAGKYGTFIGAYVLYVLIASVISLIISFATGISSFTPTPGGEIPFTIPQLVFYFIFTLLFNLLLAVLALGFNKMFLDGSRGFQVHFSDLFYGFRHHPDRVILMQLVQELIALGCCLPGCAVLIFGIVADSGAVPLIIGILLLIIGLIFSIYFSLCFSQSMYLMADYDDLGPIQALQESRRIMAGNKGRLFYLQLSFLGILLLCVLTCDIGMLWAFPYINMTYTNFYRSLDHEI